MRTRVRMDPHSTRNAPPRRRATRAHNKYNAAYETSNHVLCRCRAVRRRTAVAVAHVPTQCSPLVRVCPEGDGDRSRSEEHTSELQSRFDLVCRLLLEKK